MRNLFRHISIFACSLFWSNNAKIGNPFKFIRKYWAQLLLSSVAIQMIACAYGGEDPYDYSYDCDPVFDVEKFKNEAKTPPLRLGAKRGARSEKLPKPAT